MEELFTCMNWNSNLKATFGKRADEPVVVSTFATVITGVLSAIWFLAGSAWFFHESTVRLLTWAGAGVVALLGVLYIISVASASMSAYVLWRLFASGHNWGYLRGGSVGLAMGVLWHVITGFGWFIVLTGVYSYLSMHGVTTISLFEQGPLLYKITAGWFSIALLSFWLTFGLPVIVGAGTGLGFTYCHKNTAE
ncbi:hypothetical protein G3I44_09400 [Halogeometricum borinquense]|uniref:Uncharacterized protein n=2 Tax=Halogeometricum borinquense TaxID=60847 RepID=A0A6C0UNH1_9EURY|nr:hypothetical protein G3I44_09400 [Halogeometricum borinquense]